MDGEYQFQIDGISNVDRASLEKQLPHDAISEISGNAGDRYQHLADYSVVVDVARSALPALAAWLATRKVNLKVTRKKPSGDAWSFDLGLGADGTSKSAKAIQEVLERD